MKLRDYIKGKVTNINEKDYEEEYLDTEVEEIKADNFIDTIFIGEEAVFDIYELHGFKKWEDLTIIYGHEDIIVYNAKTKEFTSIKTR